MVLTHDVDTARGQARCLRLAQLEQESGFRSAFNFVPERYPVDPWLRQELTAEGFEVGVHGLTTTGRLYSSRAEFDRAGRTDQPLSKGMECCGVPVSGYASQPGMAQGTGH